MRNKITVIIHRGNLSVCNATCENTHSNHQSSDMTILEIAPIIFYMNLILDSNLTLRFPGT